MEALAAGHPAVLLEVAEGDGVEGEDTDLLDRQRAAVTPFDTVHPEPCDERLAGHGQARVGAAQCGGATPKIERPVGDARAP